MKSLGWNFFVAGRGSGAGLASFTCWTWVSEGEDLVAVEEDKLVAWALLATVAAMIVSISEEGGGVEVSLMSRGLRVVETYGGVWQV